MLLPAPLQVDELMLRVGSQLGAMLRVPATHAPRSPSSCQCLCKLTLRHTHGGAHHNALMLPCKPWLRTTQVGELLRLHMGAGCIHLRSPLSHHPLLTSTARQWFSSGSSGWHLLLLGQDRPVGRAVGLAVRGGEGDQESLGLFI